MIQLPSIMMDRLAARMLVGCCMVLAIGLAAAAGNRGGGADPGVRFATRPSDVLQEAGPTARASDIFDTAELAVYVLPPVIEPARPAGGDLTNPRSPVAPPAETTRTGRLVLMEVTAYCPCPACCGQYADGITASGKPVSYNDGRFVAADTRLFPFNTRMVIPGYNDGKPVEVQDRGGAIKGHKLDLFFPTHQEALNWGRQRVMVTVLE